MFYVWGHEILFILLELRMMRTEFYRSSAEKLFKLIKPAETEHATLEVTILLKYIHYFCSICQHHSPRSRLLTASVNKRILPNKTVILHLIWMHRIPLLHKAIKETHYSAALLLLVESVDQVLKAFLPCCILTCNGYLDPVRSDTGSVSLANINES